MNDNLLLLERVREGNAESESELVEKNYGLVRSLAVRFLYRGVDFEDLCQIGSIGLLKAIRNFDVSRGVMFSTYAVPVIIGEIRKFLRDDGMVKVSRTLREQYIRIRRASELFEKKQERQPTVGELAEQTGYSPEDVIAALDAGGIPLSLDEETGDDSDLSLLDRLVSEDPIGSVERIALKDGIASLEPKERQLVTLRYFCGKTQQETALQLNMTQVQVSRKEKKIMEKLRRSVQ